MNILITFLNYGEDKFGGIERATYNFARGLTACGQAVHVYTRKQDTNNRVRPKSTITIHDSQALSVQFNGSDKGIMNHLNFHKERIKEEVDGICRLYKIELIISVDHLWGILPYLQIKLPIKTVVWLHLRHNDKILKFIAEMGYYETYAVSRTLAQDLIPLLGKCPDILPNSIIIEDSEVEDRGDFIFVNARISKEKRTMDAIEIYRALGREVSDISLVLCGGKFPFLNNHEYLQQVLSSVHMEDDNIRIVENIPWAQIPSYICSAKAILLPTGAESFGMAALEAMMYRCPLVTTNAGNLPDLTEGRLLLHNVGDIEAMSMDLQRKLKTDQIKELDTLQRVSQKYDSYSVAKRFISKYEKTI